MKRDYLILIAIFAAVFLFRIFFAIGTPYFSSDNAYYNLRHTEYIMDNFKPIIFDELSYGGRYVVDSHVFHYILAGLSFLLPDFFVFKILPELLFAMMTFIVYALAKRLTKNSTAALFSALMAGFIPLFAAESINSLSLYSLLIPLLLYQVYCMLNLETHLGRFIALAFILPIIHPLSLILGISMLLYIVLLDLEGVKASKLKWEAMMLYIFVSLLASFIIYKKALMSSGLYAVWQNSPVMLISTYFQNIDIFSLTYNIGLVPLVLGIMGIIIGLFREKQKPMFLISSIILAIFMLFFLRLINFSMGMMLLGILLALVSSISIEKLIVYINMTKFARFKKLIFISSIILIAVTMIIPSGHNAKNAIDSAISSDEVSALEWIRDNTNADTTVLARVDEGNYITAIAKRKNIADMEFLFAPDRYAEAEEMLKTESLVKSTQLMKKYGVKYVFLSDKTESMANSAKIKFNDENCFKRVYSNEKSEVLKLLC